MVSLHNEASCFVGHVAPMSSDEQTHQQNSNEFFLGAGVAAVARRATFESMMHTFLTTHESQKHTRLEKLVQPLTRLCAQRMADYYNPTQPHLAATKRSFDASPPGRTQAKLRRTSTHLHPTAPKRSFDMSPPGHTQEKLR